MKFGVREIANVVFKAKTPITIGSKSFKAGQPVIVLDSAKTETLEGAATTVYATGGRGNTRLIAWEGEKTLTFTVEDALLSPLGFSILSGAGLFNGGSETVTNVHVHMMTSQIVDGEGAKIDLTDALNAEDKICATAPIFIMPMEEDGSITGDLITKAKVDPTGKFLMPASGGTFDEQYKGKAVMVDYYIQRKAGEVYELQIDAENFAGSYYVEADTLFRRQDTGVDLPAVLTLPNVKIQSNFTFTMASTGDPSTFTFTMDAFPGYTYFDSTKKVLCCIQIVDDNSSVNKKVNSVMAHAEGENYFVDAGGQATDSVGDEEE